MSSKIYFSIFLVLVVIGLAVFGYFNATPGIDDLLENYPEIEISPTDFDFGEIIYNDIVSHTFIIKNNGNEVLEIKRVSTSCACTSAEIDKERLAPGEETELLVTYNTGAMSGERAKGQQERIIYIKNNDPLHPQVEAMIYADVK